MRVQRYLWGVFLACLASFCHAAPPNIILILADDLGRECLDTYGGTYGTPRLNALAAKGVRFTRCHALPLCTPSRVQLMTGKYNSRNYIAFGSLKPGEQTFAHYLKRAGYATCVVGKWQLDGGGTPGSPPGVHPQEAGFDDYSLWNYLERGSRYADPLLKNRDTPLGVRQGAYGPDVQSDYALRFLEQHKDGPFFLYYTMTLVHEPFEATPDIDDWSTARSQKSLAHFAPMVRYMDKLVGTLLDKVHALGLDDNTVILFTGDNGTDRDVRTRMADGSTVQGGKGMTMETGTHVPLLARWPGVTQPGTTQEGLVGFEDFLPTLLDIAGVKAPTEFHCDGTSFLPQIKGEAVPRRPWQYAFYNPLHGPWPKTRYARDAHYKLYEDGRLYDSDADPLEQAALPQDKLNDAQGAVRAQLQEVLTHAEEIR